MVSLPTVKPVLPHDLHKEVDEEQLIKQMEEEVEARVRGTHHCDVKCATTCPQLSAIRNYEPPKATIGLRKVPSPEPVHHATETEEDDEEEWNSQGEAGALS